MSSVAEEVGLRLLEMAIQEAPAIAALLGVVDDAPAELPIVERLRQILPAEGAAARARRALEGG